MSLPLLSAAFRIRARARVCSLPGGFLGRLLLRGLTPLAVMLAVALSRLLYVLGRDALAGCTCAKRFMRHIFDVLPFILFVLFCFCGTVRMRWPSRARERERPPGMG